ncbi:hypothetical protein Q5P01_019795 [Channa striata]|uniref:Uncharacterized protein n=1 Tax=Channa striata TaxID=64152 RepID=A0AA88S6G5_CHASR|nr:hypothetical protein Q5P01_019795 [Channa striata]
MFVTPKSGCAVVLPEQVEQRSDPEPQTRTQTNPGAAGPRCSPQDTCTASARTEQHFAFRESASGRCQAHSGYKEHFRVGFSKGAAEKEARRSSRERSPSATHDNERTVTAHYAVLTNVSDSQTVYKEQGRYRVSANQSSGQVHIEVGIASAPAARLSLVSTKSSSQNTCIILIS